MRKLGLELEVIGSRLKEYRKKNGITQFEFSEIIGVSLTYYGEIERARKTMSLEVFARICEKSGLDPTFLLFGLKTTSAEVNSLLSDCPEDKLFDVINIIRHASNLYRDS